MKNISLEDMITAQDIQDELGITYPTALALLRKVGDPYSKGRFMFWDRREVKEHLRLENIRLLAFLDCAPKAATEKAAEKPAQPTFKAPEE